MTPYPDAYEVCLTTWTPRTCQGWDQRSPVDHVCMQSRAFPHVCVCVRCSQRAVMPRRAPGESWQRAMDGVAERIAKGSKKRYQVYGYKIDEGWWAYSFRRAPKPPHVSPARPPMSDELLAELSGRLPRCAQRARAQHGGNSKLALPDERTAQEVALFLGVQFYRCELPAPAIGRHWHVTTSKRKRRK